jgi:eukaryotic-like serine/threonine-protein kinase
MAQSDPLIGATLDGKYRIEALLGSGSMGRVYRARHLSLASWRAIKVMRAELAKDAAFVERFQREARLLEELRHPHLVALYDFAQLPDGAWYIASEFVEGETLAAHLARCVALSAVEAVRLFAQLAEGVAAAHAKGVVHRDLSPENIMISDAPSGSTAKVLDFGLAKSMLSEAPAAAGYSLVVGKVGYAAPEQMGLVATVQDIDARADVFSLAAVLYRALFGRLPWRVDGLQSYVHDLLIQPEADLTRRIAGDIPPQWARFFSHALARRREERTPTATQFKHELGETATRLRIGLKPPAAASLARRASIWLGAATAAVALASLLALGLMRGRAPDQPSPTSPVPSIATREVTPPTPGALPPDMTPQSPTPAAAASVRHAPIAARDARAALSGPLPTSPEPSVTEMAKAEASPATLLIRSTPAASVRVDGDLRGRTPLDVSLAPGTHRLLLSSDDGQEEAVHLELAAGQMLEHHHRFAGFGVLAVVAEPWIEVSLDDGPYRETPVRFERTKAGVHRIRGRRPGFAPVEQEVSVEKDQTRSIRIEPKPSRTAE